MNVSKNILRCSVGWILKSPQQSTVLKNDSRSNSTYCSEIKN